MKPVTMKRVFAGFGAAVFIAGMLVLPALRRLHCHEAVAVDGHLDCALCALATSPLETADTRVSPNRATPPAEACAPCPPLIIPRAPRSATQPRAPPAA